MDKLQKLQLDNNIICRIQGLDHLVNLEWLDLSFNLIEKIEGVEKLTKLTDLSLFSNNISQISGLETLSKLNVLSLGSNKILDHVEAIRYLYNLRLPNLQVLKMADNPFFKTKEIEYRNYSIAFLKKLKYLDYELIDEELRNTASEKHREEFQEQEAQKNQEGAVTEEQERQADPALKDAKIENTVGMIARILREDADSKMLSSLPKFQEILAPYDTVIEDATQKFQHEMKSLNKEKLNTIVYCEQVLRTSEKQAEYESIGKLDTFTKLRKHKFRMLAQQNGNYNFAAFKKELLTEIDKLEDDLMSTELKLQEILGLSTQDFTDRVKKTIEIMKAKILVFIKEVQSQMEQFSIAVKAYALQELERFENLDDDANAGELDNISNDLITLMSDPEALNQHLEASKENIDSRIGDQETIIQRELLRDWRNTETRITEDQHHRNRTIVKEIISTCEKLRKEISKCIAFALTIPFVLRRGSGRDPEREGEPNVISATITSYKDLF